MRIYFVTPILLVLLVVPSSSFAHPAELNGTVTDVIDGDTFRIAVANSTRFTIRMADINASEFGQIGYSEAKSSLISYVYERSVYLDVDDEYTWDSRGQGNRVVAVTYIDFNSTCFLNVNEAMFLGGYVEKRDYPNEFSPYSWNLYVSKNLVNDTISDPFLFPILLFVVIAVMVAIYLLRSSRK